MNWTDLFQNWVEAYTASWIEISVVIIEKINRKSRGLYSLVDWNLPQQMWRWKRLVEAYTASWIEIQDNLKTDKRRLVEAYTASWIEIRSSLVRPMFFNSRGLYSLVDWNTYDDYSLRPGDGRGLYSLVDWNLPAGT